MLTLIVFRVATSPRRVVSQLAWLGYDDGPLILVVDGKNKSALAATAVCYELLSRTPVTKTASSPITASVVAGAIGEASARVALVLGESGLERMAHVLTGATVAFHAGEGAVLEIEEASWSAALKREGAWTWNGTITPSEAR